MWKKNPDDEKIGSDIKDIYFMINPNQLMHESTFIRYQTLGLGQVFLEFGNEKITSYGLYQFPTLGFVVERYCTKLSKILLEKILKHTFS